MRAREGERVRETETEGGRDLIRYLVGRRGRVRQMERGRRRDRGHRSGKSSEKKRDQDCRGGKGKKRRGREGEREEERLVIGCSTPAKQPRKESETRSR